MAKQGIHQTRPLVWEDDAPMEPRFRRVQKSTPFSNQKLPGMPVAMDELDDADETDRMGYRGEVRPWWRPAGTVGRVLIGIALTAMLAGAAWGVHVARQFFDHDSRFRIAGADNLQFTGMSQVTRADLLAVFGEDMGRNIFFIPLGQRRAQIEQIPWVERATVMRLLPDQIRVSIVERNPVAFARHGGQIGLVDANGMLLDMPAAAMAQHHFSFPVLTGIDARDPISSRQQRMALYLRLMSDLDANGHHNSDPISEIDLTDPEDARVVMPEQGGDILAHFGEDHFLERYQRYTAHIAEWLQQYPHLSAVDLRYDQQVVLEMKPGTDGAPAAATNAASGAAAPAPSAPVPSASASSAPAAAVASPVSHFSRNAAVRTLASKKETSAPAHPLSAKKHATPKATSDAKTKHALQARAKARPSDQEIESAAAKQRAVRAKRKASAQHASATGKKHQIAKANSTAAGRGE